MNHSIERMRNRLRQTVEDLHAEQLARLAHDLASRPEGADQGAVIARHQNELDRLVMPYLEAITELPAPDLAVPISTPRTIAGLGFRISPTTPATEARA